MIENVECITSKEEEVKVLRDHYNLGKKHFDLQPTITH